MSGELLQMAVMPGRERSWVDGDDQLCGYVVRADDVDWATTPRQLVEAHGLTFPGSPFTGESAAVDVLRFPVTPFVRTVSATGATTVAGESHGEGFVDHPPFTGNGFVGVAEDRFIPLWWLEPMRVPAGAELWRFHADGSSELVTAYANVASGWLATPPPTITPSDVLGTFARWRGHEVLADVLPNGSAVVASRVELEGLRPTERGLFGAAVDPAELEDLHALRLTATWRGLPFQLVRRWQDPDGAVMARLVYLGRDARAAEAAGLQKMEAGVYEVSAPLAELTDLAGTQFTV